MNQSNDVQANASAPDLYELVKKWNDFNERRQEFQYESGAFRQEEFVALMKETVSKVCAFRVRALDFYNNTAYLKKQMWHFTRLMMQTERYSADIIDPDESDDMIFSASLAIVRLFQWYASSDVRALPMDETGVLVGECEDCRIYCPAEESRDSEFWSQTFEYDPAVGDMSKFIELAKRGV